MVRCLRVMWLLVTGMLLSTLAMQGADIVVSTDGTGSYRSIQRAIDAASYGDTIVVNPGIYDETLVLISGITIRGAGSGHTIIRSSYGYQPVVKGGSVGSVVMEDLTLERGVSILGSVVVDLQSSDIAFKRCRITGGQEGGVRSTGVARLSFDGCRVEDNAGYGLQISAASDLDVRNSIIARNGSIGLYLLDTPATVMGTTFEWNEWDGILLEGMALLDVSDSAISDNGRRGIHLLDSAVAVVANCTFSTQAFGNVLIEGASHLQMTASNLKGGTTCSVESVGGSSLTIQSGHITNAAGIGVRASGSGALTIGHTVIAYCGDGLLLETEGLCEVFQSTIAMNSGNGLESIGGRIEVSQSIVAMNAGIGFDVRTPTGITPSHRFEYNNVWGNRSGDYSGIHRSASDTSEAPEFVNPESGDWSLAPSSPSLEAGAFGSVLGAGLDARRQGGGHIELGFTRLTSNWGTIELGGLWHDVPFGGIEGLVSWQYPWRACRAAASAAITGSSSVRAEASIEYSPQNPIALLGSSAVPHLGITGVFDDLASRWQAWGSLHIRGELSSLRVGASVEGPTGLTRQDVELSLHGFTLAAQAMDLTLTDLSIVLADEFMLSGASTAVSVSLSAIPNLQLALAADWTLVEASIRLQGTTFLGQLGTSSVILEWRDGLATQVSVSLRLRSGRFEDVEARVRTQVANLSLMGSLGANAIQGPRRRLGIVVDTSSWFMQPANQSPVPAYSHSPREPEAGEVITFDASASVDPDGELDQIWWDFGDGTAAIGSLVEHRFESPGEYTIALTVSDEQGAVTTLVDAFQVLVPLTTPVASFTWAPISEGGTRLQRPLRAGDLILLDAMDSRDPNGEIAEYGWDIQSDGIFDYIGDDPRRVIDPMTVGTWPVTLRVVDDEGNSDAVMRVLAIEELKKPEADFSLSPATPAVGDPIRFADESIAWDSAIISWEWDFGNGRTSREQEPTHRYQAAGVYDVSLTVHDSEGLHDTQSRWVNVEQNPALVPIQHVWALLIGISDYAEVEDLSYARQDAEGVGAWLVESGVPVDHIRLLTDDASAENSHGLTSELATLVNVRAELGWLRQMAGRDDLVLIHFSGHGYQGADDNLDEQDGVDEFFVLHDTRAAAKDDTALRDDEFGRFLDRIESNHVLVFFDSCYSGGLSRSLTPGSRATGEAADVFSDFRLEGRLVLSASSENQDAFESPQLEHGVLTHFLLEGLNGAADLNADGHVTIWELFEHVRSSVPSFVQSERGEIQLPQLLGQGDSRVILKRASDIPAFSYCPTIPIAGALTSFRSESHVGADTLLWDFDDGTTATGQEVSHRYASPGTYNVQLQSTDMTGAHETQSLPLPVSTWATVVGLSTDGAQAIISAGRQHGIAMGDQLALQSPGESANDDPTPLLEVVELIGEDSAVCLILQLTESIASGSKLILLPDANKPSCFGSP